MPSKMAVKVECYMDTIYKEAAILVFPKYAVCFKLHYFKLIHLQANMLSSFISTYFAVNHINLPQNCHLGFECLGHSLKVAVTFCIQRELSCSMVECLT